MASLKYWVWLSTLPGIGARTAGRLLDAFGSPEQIFFADKEAFARVSDLTEAEREALSHKSLLAARKTLEECAGRGYTPITLNDGAYPERLRNIPDPPVVLYVRGRLPILDEEAAVAVVGTRRCTPYGIRAAERMGYELCRSGCTVVTGLARGIDTAAARGALRAGGPVVGVLGTGLNVVYPPENRQLFNDVAASGAILSEYAPDTPAASGHFPRRNRIMSGVSVAVAVIEAPSRSGALITAGHALEQGRDVYALPGNVDSPSFEGSNRLLQEGAMLVTSGVEIAREYTALYPDKIRPATPENAASQRRKQVSDDGESAQKRQNPAKKEIDNERGVEYIDLEQLRERLSGDELQVASVLGEVPLHVDEVIAASGLGAADVLTALTMLELDGYVEQTAGKYFRLAQRPV